jgi:L-cysteine/cystine lyase
LTVVPAERSISRWSRDRTVDSHSAPVALGDEEIERLRAMLPATEKGAYLNTGTAGPMPRSVIAEMRRELDIQLTLPRSEPAHLDRYLALADENRAAVASLLGCEPSEVALTHSTTEGMGVVTLGIEWKPGDEAITTTLEHPGALFPLWVVRDRFGVDIRSVAIDLLSDSEIVTAIAEALTPRTRLVSLSHVSFQNGQLLPIRAIAEIVRAHGALLLVDGAQGYGALDVDMGDLGCDAYAVSGQKWQLGPEGTGGLFCRADVLERLKVTIASYGTAKSYTSEGYVPHNDGRRLEFGTTNTIGWVGQLAAICFLRDTVGITAASARAGALAASTISQLESIDGVQVLTPPDRHVSLVTFTIGGVDATDAVERLARLGVNGRSIRELGAIRLSVAFFTTESEIARAVAAVAEIASSSR